MAIGDIALYACPTNLPTTAGQFTQIYNLGPTAGVCTFAVLNDRVVITEGFAQPPLVWGGCMETDASDWMAPKNVLSSLDGDNYQDVSAQACDADSTNEVNVGGMGASGGLYFCCDMPIVDAFYVQVATANTLSLAEGSRTFTIPVLLDSTADVDREDLRATITQWVKDSTKKGHFTDGVNPVTLGPGMTAPLVEAGLEVVINSVSYKIVAITGDGSGTDGVELSADAASNACSGIYNCSISAEKLTINDVIYATNTTTYSNALTGGGQRWSAYSIRQIISGAELSNSGNSFRMQIKAGAFTDPTGTLFFAKGAGNNLTPRVDSLAPAPVFIRRISIVERSGSTDDGTTTPTLLYFSDNLPYHRFTTTGEDVWTRQQTYAIDETKDYLIHMDLYACWEREPVYVFNGSTYVWLGGYKWTRWGLLAMGNGAGAYIKENTTDYYPEEYNLQTVSGYTELTGVCIGVSAIEVSGTVKVLQAQSGIAHTTSTTQQDISIAEVFQGVTVDQATPGSTTVWHLVSTDGRNTWKAFLSGVWRDCVKFDTVWKYKDAAGVWQNATTNTLHGAFRQAFAVAQNQMTATQLAAITAAQWIASGGIVPKATSRLDFACSLNISGTDVPSVTSYSWLYNDGGYVSVQVWQNGGWTNTSWTDGTVSGGISLAQSGIIEGTASVTADYAVINGVAGYWFRLIPSGTSATTSITKVRYSAPCQPLANIGDGQPDICSQVAWWDAETGIATDMGSEMADYSYTSTGSVVVPLTTNDYIYVGYLLRFSAIWMAMYVANTTDSVLSIEYWNGTAWTELTIADGTSDGGETLAQTGTIEWTVPDDWKTNLPASVWKDKDDEKIVPHKMYWVRLSVSVNLTTSTAIAEMRVQPVPEALVKHRFVAAAKDRIALGSRPDAWDQVDISGELEEYRFLGQDSGSYRVGGMDRMVALFSAWNGLFVVKPESIHQLEGSSPSNFGFQSVEASGYVPINSQVVIKAPSVGQGEGGSPNALYFINRSGAYLASGLHVDSSWNSGRISSLSAGVVDWWADDTAVFPRLDLGQLHRACGVFWPPENWLVWSVPMLLASPQTSQTSNNRLLVYDLTLGAWLPPFDLGFGVASLCTAFHYAADGQGKLGPIGLYAGDYQGRVLRLFGSGATTDLGTSIACWVETPWMQLSEDGIEALVRNVQAWGKAAGNIVVTVYANWHATAVGTWTLSDLASLGGKEFTQYFAGVQQPKVRYLKLRIAWTGVAEIYRNWLECGIDRRAGVK